MADIKARLGMTPVCCECDKSMEWLKTASGRFIRCATPECKQYHVECELPLFTLTRARQEFVICDAPDDDQREGDPRGIHYIVHAVEEIRNILKQAPWGCMLR
jgi:hypothetical protein